MKAIAVKQIHSAPPTTVEAVRISPRRTTIWLWRKQAIGYALAGALHTFLALLPLAIVAMALVDGSLYAAAGFGSLSALSLGMLVWYLRGMQDT